MGVCCTTTSTGKLASDPPTRASNGRPIPVIRVLCRPSSFHRTSEDRQSLSTVSVIQGKVSDLAQQSTLCRAQTWQPQSLQTQISRTNSDISPDTSTLQYSQSDLPEAGPSANSLDLVTPLQSAMQSCPSLVGYLPISEASLHSERLISEETESQITRIVKKTYREDGSIQINQYRLRSTVASSKNCTLYYATADTHSFLVSILKTSNDVLGQAAELCRAKHPTIMPLVEVIVPYCNSQIIVVQGWTSLPSLDQENALRCQVNKTLEFLEEKSLVSLFNPDLLPREEVLQVPQTPNILATPSTPYLSRGCSLLAKQRLL